MRKGDFLSVCHCAQVIKIVVYRANGGSNQSEREKDNRGIVFLGGVVH